MNADIQIDESEEFERLLLGIRAIAQTAAEWVRVQRPEGRVRAVDTKSSSTDIVTKLDRQCEEMLRSRILSWRADDGIVGEEGNDIGGTSGLTWVIDPIDGTVNFAYGIGGYAISIAAVQDDATVVGYVINIASGEEFGAIAGRGSWRWADDARIRLSGPPPTKMGQMLVATGFNYQVATRAEQGLAVARLLPHIRDIRRLGAAALDFTSLAEGSLDAYVEQGLKVWDIAAGGLIAREAGLVVTGLDGEANERLTVGARPEMIDEFLALIRQCGF